VSDAAPLSQRLQAAKREAILAASAEAFAAHGFAATTVEAIAKQVGVGKGTIYGLWPSKEDLLLACCLGACARDREAVLSLGRSAWPGFDAAMEAIANGGQPDLSGLPDPVVFTKRLLAATLTGLIERSGADCRMFIDLVQVATRHPEQGRRVRAAIDAMLSGWEALTAALLAEGRRRGAIVAQADPVAQSRLLLLAIDGLLLQNAWGRFPDPHREAERLVTTWFAPLEVRP
jgi:AcrR family transcriptional regulator